MKNPIPTVSQIQHVQHFLTTDLFDIPTIARLTGVSLRDIFRIKKSMYPPIIVSPDGIILDGQHRLLAAKQH